eukprot:1778952-Rhodomonas_salina.3
MAVHELAADGRGAGRERDCERAALVGVHEGVVAVVAVVAVVCVAAAAAAVVVDGDGVVGVARAALAVRAAQRALRVPEAALVALAPGRAVLAVARRRPRVSARILYDDALHLRPRLLLLASLASLTSLASLPHLSLSQPRAILGLPVPVLLLLPLLPLLHHHHHHLGRHPGSARHRLSLLLPPQQGLLRPPDPLRRQHLFCLRRPPNDVSIAQHRCHIHGASASVHADNSNRGSPISTKGYCRQLTAAHQAVLPP